MPRTEIATSRAAISKIQKDFERIKSIMLNTSNEVSLLRASNETDSSRQGNNIRNNNSDSKFNGLVVSEPLSSNANQYNPPQQQQQLTMKPLMEEHDVDQMIIEERERDIRKVNHDLALVNEMFKYSIHLYDLYPYLNILQQRHGGDRGATRNTSGLYPRCHRIVS